MTKKFNVTGMTCSACAQHVERAARRVDGVTRADVNLLLNTMEVECGEVSSDKIISAIEKAGYGAAEIGAESKGVQSVAQNADHKKAWIRLWVSIGFLIPLM